MQECQAATWEVGKDRKKDEKTHYLYQNTELGSLQTTCMHQVMWCIAISVNIIDLKCKKTTSKDRVENKDKHHAAAALLW